MRTWCQDSKRNTFAGARGQRFRASTGTLRFARPGVVRTLFLPAHRRVTSNLIDTYEHQVSMTCIYHLCLSKRRSNVAKTFLCLHEGWSDTVTRRFCHSSHRRGAYAFFEHVCTHFLIYFILSDAWIRTNKTEKSNGLENLGAI